MGTDEETADGRPPLRPSGLDPQIANEVADLFRAAVADLDPDLFVTLDARYGFAEELYARRLLREPFRVGSRVTVDEQALAGLAFRTYVLVEATVVENERVWVIEPDEEVLHEEKYAVFEGLLRHAPVAHGNRSAQ